MITKLTALVLTGILVIGSSGCGTDAAALNNIITVHEDEFDKNVVIEEQDQRSSNDSTSKAYKYNKNDGIFVFYETEDAELYRQLLPKEFDMPDELIVHLFIMDFYEIDSDAEPYKEMSISLLAKYENEDIWHCIYMPVTSEQSMRAGKLKLGLPKTLGSIDFTRDDSTFIGSVTDNQNRSATVKVETEDYNMSLAEVRKIRGFMNIPKMNLLDGEVIQMTRSGGQVNIIDVSRLYPELVKIVGGSTTIEVHESNEEDNHPLDMKPSKIIASYYLHNEIPFSLDRK